MKKFNGLAKSFSFLVTVIFLASCLLVGCKDPDPEPTPEPESTVQYMVTYMVDDSVSANENFDAPALPKNGKVDKGTVVNPPAPAEVIGWSFGGWYVDDVKVPTNGITITKDTTFVAKFTENVAPELPADPEPGNPSEEEQVPTYTITNVKSDWVNDNDVVIYAYLPSTDDETQKDYLFYGSYDNETVTFSTDEEFSTAILITVPQGTSIDGLLPKWDAEKDNIWNYKIKQSVNLDFNGVTTVALPEPPTTKTFYLDAGGSSLWDQGDAWFEAWIWGEGFDDTWVTFEKTSEESIYSVEVPVSITGMKIIRRSASHSAGSWKDDDKWNNTDDIEISEGMNLITITGWETGDYEVSTK